MLLPTLGGMVAAASVPSPRVKKDRGGRPRASCAACWVQGQTRRGECGRPQACKCPAQSCRRAGCPMAHRGAVQRALQVLDPPAAAARPPAALQPAQALWMDMSPCNAHANSSSWGAERRPAQGTAAGRGRRRERGDELVSATRLAAGLGTTSRLSDQAADALKDSCSTAALALASCAAPLRASPQSNSRCFRSSSACGPRLGNIALDPTAQLLHRLGVCAVLDSRRCEGRQRRNGAAGGALSLCCKRPFWAPRPWSCIPMRSTSASH